MELRIILVEHQRMTRLAIRGEADPLIEPAGRLGFVAIIAIELLAVHRRNVVRKMALMIEAQNVGIARLVADELEFRMRVGEGGKSLRVTARRPRQLEDDLLRWIRTQMERIGGQC